MSILYALVAKDRDIVLSEYTEFSGNFQQLIRQLMLKLRPNARQTFENGQENCFHTLTENNLIFICMTDIAVKKIKGFSFLETIKEKFYNTFSMERINRAIAFGLNFTDELKSTMFEFNNNMEDDKAEAVIIELNAVKDVMVENLSKILERDVKINVVLSKSQAMHGVSATYKKHAAQYRRQQRNRYIKYGLLLFLVVAIIAYFISVAICGWSYSDC